MAKKPEPEETDLRRAERREAEARTHFEACGGPGGEVMQALSRFFALYAHKPRPDLFIDTLARIDELRIMQLPEHRYGVAGAIAAIFSLHPEHQDGWRAEVQKRPQLSKILASAERLAPPLTDETIKSPGAVDYLWMNWLITRDNAALRRVFKLAHRLDPVGEAALAMLHLHAEMPEVQVELMGTLQKRQQSALPYATTIPQNVPVQDVTALRQLVASTALAIRQVVLVGWLPGDDGGFLVVTVDGRRPSNCPTQWRQRPVKVRKANPEELRAHQELLARAEDP